MAEKRKIIIIDDDPILVEALKALLDSYDVSGFTSSGEGIESLKKNSYDLLILDYLIDALNGADVVKKVRSFNKEICILLLTGNSDIAPAMESLKNLDIQHYCEKDPDNITNLLIIIESIFKTIEHFEKINDESFASRIKVLRQQHGLSQKEVGAIAGVTREAVAQWEMGKNEPTLDAVRKLADYFKVSMDYIVAYNLGTKK